MSKLPPITQEGKRTFGCLVNGKAWIPQNEGLIITTPALRFTDENTNGGLFYINAERVITPDNIDEFTILAADSCISAKNYPFVTNSNSTRFAFYNAKNNSSECNRLFSSENDVKTIGYISITYFSLSKGIIAGTFEFTLSKNGCETVKITNGRFDAKL